MTRIK